MVSNGSESDDVESSSVDTDSAPVDSSPPVRESNSGAVTSMAGEDAQEQIPQPAQQSTGELEQNIVHNLKQEAPDTADEEQVAGDGEPDDQDGATDGNEEHGEEDGDAGRTRSSRYRGVCWNKKNKRWQAAINTQGRYIYLGSFHSEERAARAFDLAAIKLRGPRARLNFACGDYLSKVGGLIEESALDNMVQAADDKQDTWRAIRRRRRRKACIITQPVSSNQSTGTEFLSSGADPAWQGLGPPLPSRLRPGLVGVEASDRNASLLLNFAAASNGGAQGSSVATPQVHQVQLQLEGGGTTLINVGPDGTLLGLPPGQHITLQQLLGLQGEGAAQVVGGHRLQQQASQTRQQGQQHSLMQQLHAARPSGYQNSPQVNLRQAGQQPRRSSDDSSMLNWLSVGGKASAAQQEAPAQSTSFTIPSSMLPQLLSMAQGPTQVQASSTNSQVPDSIDGSSAVATVEALVPNSTGSMQCVIYRTVSSPDRLTCTLVSTEGSPHHLGAYNSLSDAHQACVAAMKLLESVGNPRGMVELGGTGRQSASDMQLLLQQQQYAQQHGQHPHHLQSVSSHTPTLASLPYVLLSQSSDNDGIHHALLQAQQQSHSRETQHYADQLGHLVVSGGMHSATGQGSGHDLVLLATQEGLHAASRKHEVGGSSSSDHNHGPGKRQLYEDVDPRQEGSKRQRTAMVASTDSGSPQAGGNVVQHDQTLQALLRQAIMLHAAGN